AIFDFDGTIVDSKELAFHLLNDLSDKYRFNKISRSELEVLTKLPIKDRLKILNIPFYKVPSMVIDLKKGYKTIIQSIKPFEGIRDVVVSLKQQGIQTIIISSNTVQNIKEFLVANDLDLFETIHSQKNIFGKHRSIQALLQNLNVNKEDVIYIGDELRDIVACKRVNIKIISVTWGIDSFELLQAAAPDFIAHKPLELLKIMLPEG
ncbi:MAG: haloacid dehalogenase superfamily enzyme subfamily, partial [Bacilli bacterium]|nr:haloacid dehalogenase superfamily enzyme subfamily [Bacilli bacterium]